MNNQKGVFSNVNDAIYAATSSFKLYSKLSLRDKEEVIREIRRKLVDYIDLLAEMSLKETCMGNLEDKKLKIKLAIEETPGTEILMSEIRHGDGGFTLFEYTPYGIACAIQPSTNPCETMINNTIALLAAGNTVINCPHPRAMNVSKFLTNIINTIISDLTGIENVVVTLDECKLAYIKEIMNHPDVDLVVSTGGSDNARSAVSCGKKVIAAGPANPTFIVDETADIKRAADCITRGASFDNNIMCITEKNIIVVDEVARKLEEELKKNGVFYVKDIATMLKLSKLLLTEDMKPNKLYGGKDADVILKDAGIKTDRSYKLIAVETVKIHPFVTEELLMPLVSIVRAKDFDEALEMASDVEQGCRHTSGIHSNRMDRLRLAERVMKTSIFIKNGCSLDGIGICGVGGTSFTIANITGEGAVTARDFSRKRRCVTVDTLTIL